LSFSEALLADFDALPMLKQDGAARQLSQLWDWFRDEFGGPAEFMAKPSKEQEAYIDKLGAAVERSTRLKDTDLGRYYFSSALLREYLAALRANDISPTALAISDRVAWMVERGRELAAPRP
jgi:hypothetical protein